MEKTARRPSADPVQERLRANKAAWNKEVSAFINDLIHFKKMMNGWPSKFFKERSRITQPIPADPATIIGSLAGDFQEIANKGNGLIQEQIDYAKNRRQRQPKPAAPAPGQAPAAPATPAAPEAPKAPDLTQQLQKGLAASENDSPLIKLAADLEYKYEFESYASNPFSRFITRLFTPKIGFGEGARVRRLRMTMLDSSVKAYKELKRLQKEIVKSSKGSIVESHKMMTTVWNYWSIVYRLLSTYRAIRPGDVRDPGGLIEDEDLKRERAREEGREPEEGAETGAKPTTVPVTAVEGKLKDFRDNSSYLGPIAKNPQFGGMQSTLERLQIAPKGKKLSASEISALEIEYTSALQATNQELGTSGNSFSEVVQQYQAKNAGTTKEAQVARELRKLRHQILPGATSGQRLEVYNLITQVRQDINEVMDLLEAGFDQDKLAEAITRVHREMSMLRTTMRSLYYSEKPGEAPPFF